MVSVCYHKHFGKVGICTLDGFFDYTEISTRSQMDAHFFVIGDRQMVSDK